MLYKLLVILFSFLWTSFVGYTQQVFVPEILYSKQSSFGLIEIVTTPVPNILNICENKDYDLAHSVIIERDLTYLGAEYQPFITVSFCFSDEIKNVLLLGLGGGEFLSYFIHYFPSTDMDVIEINPVMIDIVKNFRKVKTKKNVKFIIKDSFSYVKTTKNRYDLIFCDIYFFKPSTAREYKGFFENIKRNLNENGVFVWNAYIPFISRDVVRDMFKNFQHVVAAVTKTDPNIIFICYQGPEKTKEELKGIGNKLQVKYGFRYSLPDLINQFESIASTEKEEWATQFPSL